MQLTKGITNESIVLFKIDGDTSWTVDVIIAINTIYLSKPHGFEGSNDITTGKGDAEVLWI